jgi:signal transduction histidine kinase
MPIVPPPFSNADHEYVFRREYARTGHRQSLIGLSTGLALAIVAICLSFIFKSPGLDPPAQWALFAIRISIALALGMALLNLPPREKAEPRDYLRWVIAPASFAVLALILNYWIASRYDATPPPAARIFLVSALALWLYCAYARPSSRTAIALTIASSLGATVAGFISEGLLMLDTVAYLLIANFSAVSVTVQSEKRARALFQRTLELEESQRELRSKSERAIRSRDFKSRVLTTVSHDLRQPLLGADLILSTHLARIDGPEAAKLQRVSDALRQIEAGLDAILRAAAVDEIDTDTALQPIDVTLVVSQVLSEVEPIARQLGIDIFWRNHLPPNTHVMSSPTAIRTALSNLVGNALKFQRGSANPWVLLRAFRPSREIETVCIEVVDNGPGIDPASAQDVFATGYRLPRDNDVPGFGIWLASVAQQMRELPNHEVTLVRRRRKGARFRLSFPAAPAPLAPESEV